MGGTTTIDDIMAVLEARRPLQPLQPRRIWDEALDRQLAELRIRDLGALAGETDKILSIQAGLHLWNDSLDRSHKLSQDLEHPTGSYWHGIMHRMEGDFGNSKYWMRLAGKHPAMLELHREAQRWLREEGQLEAMTESESGRILLDLREGEAWDSYRFVDAVERLQYESQPDDRVRQALEQLQYIEMRCLLRYCLSA